ncbi:MAG: hypothetical protein ACHQAY_04125 [Hyphomicrobiales bacterium]
MLDWYQTHQREIHDWLEWGLRYNLFLMVSALMYVVFAAGLFALGAKYHAATVRKETGPGQYPEGYFTMLVAQLLPLTITGLVLLDGYIIATRIGTLFVVVIVHAMVTSKDGTFLAWRYHAGMMMWLSAAILGTMVWGASPAVRRIVHDYEKWIAWISVGFMIVFVARGQWVIAKALFWHFLQGNYTVKRFSLQMARFFGFAFQALHYWLLPTAAAPLFGYDPIFLQGLIGTVGVTCVILGSIIGLVVGTGARRQKVSPG